MLFLTGRAPDYAAPNYVRSELFPIKYNENKGMAFALGMAADTDGKIIESGRKISIKGARKIILYFVTETGFESFDKMPVTDTGLIKQNVLSVSAEFVNVNMKN